MQSKLNPYISFENNTRQAMEFYKDVFGGKLTMRSMSSSLATSGGANLSVDSWVSLTRTPLAIIASLTARPVISSGSTSTPAHSPRARTATTPCPISASNPRPNRAPSSAALAWNSPVDNIAITSRPIAAANGFPPNVDPCDPAVIGAITSASAATAETGYRPPPRALPRT